MARALKRVTVADGNYIAQEQIDPGDPVVLDEPNISDEMKAPETETPSLADLPPAEASAPDPEPFVFQIPACPLTLPPPRPGYCRRHLEAQLDVRQAATLTRLMHGLDQAGVRLANGRRVTSAADTVRWLLEWASQNDRAEPQ